MQNRYVGDIGDFGKYGLLRSLCSPHAATGSPQLSLGVVWYLVPDETGNADGNYIQYLQPSPRTWTFYRSCDPQLYDELRGLVLRTERYVSAVRQAEVLPTGPVFYEAPLAFEGMPSAGPLAMGLRLAHRSRWVHDGVEAMTGRDVVFIDPDNGLEVPSTARCHKRGPKYCFFDELSPYLRRGQSLILYQHIGRNRAAAKQIEDRLSQINERLEGIASPFALLFHRGTSRAFLIVPSQSHNRVLFAKALRFLAGCWSQHRHFALIPPRRQVVG